MRESTQSRNGIKHIEVYHSASLIAGSIGDLGI